MAISITADSSEELLTFACALSGLCAGGYDAGFGTDNGCPVSVVCREDGEDEPTRATLSPDFGDTDVYTSIDTLVESCKNAVE